MRVSFQRARLVFDVEKLESDVVALQVAPDKIDDTLQCLIKLLGFDGGHVSYEHSLLVRHCVVNVKTRKTIAHLQSVTEGNDFHVVPFVAVFHFSAQRLCIEL
jgi:hypothetical protein